MYRNCILRSKASDIKKGKSQDLTFIKLKSVLACDTLNLIIDSLLKEGGLLPG
jgi:hypothetical protein